MAQAVQRFEEWASNLSRGAYAALSGLLTGGIYLAIGAAFRYEPLLVQAPVMAVLIFVGFYVFNLRRWGD